MNSKDSDRPKPDAPEMKRNEWDERRDMVERNLGKGKRKKPQEKPTQTPIRLPRNSHGWLRRELGTTAMGGEQLTAYSTEPPTENH